GAARDRRAPGVETLSVIHISHFSRSVTSFLFRLPSLVHVPVRVRVRDFEQGSVHEHADEHEHAHEHAHADEHERRKTTEERRQRKDAGLQGKCEMCITDRVSTPGASTLRAWRRSRVLAKNARALMCISDRVSTPGAY